MRCHVHNNDDNVYVHCLPDAIPRSVSSNIGSVTDWDKSPDDMKSMPLTLRDQSPDNYEEEYNPKYDDQYTYEIMNMYMRL